MTRASIIFSISLFLTGIISNAQAVRFTASVDAQQVLENNVFEIRFTLENGEGRNFTPPDFSAFQVYSGPNSSTQMTIVNGAMSRKMSYSYSLLALKEGNYTIAPASIQVGSKSYNSNPVSIQVLQARETSNEDEIKDLFVEIEISDSIAYIGQQVSLKYVIYTTKNVNSVDFIKEPEYEGFFVQRIRNFTENSERVVINGVQYLRKTLRYLALFPQQSGRFPIDAAILNLGIPMNDSRFSFFTTRLEYERASTKATSIQVVPLPANAPVSFSGAVGKYSMRAGIDKKTVAAEDAFTLQMNISGYGDAKYVLPPVQSFDASFEVYDPNILTDNSREVADKIRVDKQFEYLVVPKAAGSFTLRPEFSYFDPDSNAYYTLNGGPFRLNVTGNGNKPSVTDIKGETLAEFHPNMTSSSFRQETYHFLFSPLYWVLASIPLFGILVVGFIKFRKIKLAATDPTLLKQSAAKKVALSKLRLAKEAMVDNIAFRFYEEINHGLLGYASDKFSISQASLNREKVKDAMVKEDVSPILIERFMSIINTCQMALYAAKPEKSNESIYTDALKLITDLESELK